jgi:hypothetical protein
VQGDWIKKPADGSATSVFLHGVLSSGEACWRHANGTFWPELLAREEAVAEAGVYVFTYKTGFFSGTYSLGDVVDALKEHMHLDHVMKSRRIVFVCHSMGGIVARRFVVQQAAELIKQRKSIGLFLVASPSLDPATRTGSARSRGSSNTRRLMRSASSRPTRGSWTSIVTFRT